MTKRQFADIAYTLGNGWPGQFDEHATAVYFKVLGGYDYEVVAAAVLKLIEEGSQYVPSVARVKAAVAGMLNGPVPSWTEAWDQLGKMVDRAARGFPENYSRPAAEYGEGVAHPLVVAFADHYGLRKLGMLEVYDPVHGELRLRQLGEQFREFCGAQQEKDRRQVALASVSSPMLEAARRALPVGVDLGGEVA